MSAKGLLDRGENVGPDEAGQRGHPVSSTARCRLSTEFATDFQLFPSAVGHVLGSKRISLPQSANQRRKVRTGCSRADGTNDLSSECYVRLHAGSRGKSIRFGNFNCWHQLYLEASLASCTGWCISTRFHSMLEYLVTQSPRSDCRIWATDQFLTQHSVRRLGSRCHFHNRSEYQTISDVGRT